MITGLTKTKKENEMNIIKEFLPETMSYINTINTRERVGHHNYVIEQKICNTSKPIVDFSNTELKRFDKECLNYLKRLDKNESVECAE
jgi:SNF2 family DNA or RNA helicase